MPTNRRRRRLQVIPKTTEAEWLFLIDERDKAKKIDVAVHLLPMGGGSRYRDLWKRACENVMAFWIERYPGTRPQAWWDFDAPRQTPGTHPECWLDGKMCQPRKQLGSTGVSAHEVLAILPSYDHGIPKVWERGSKDNLPLFESQAAYLKRHGLLTGKEEKLELDFTPEEVDFSVV